MRHFLSIAFLFSTAIAQKVDCSTLIVDPYWSVAYSEVENFPDPVRKFNKTLFDLKQTYRFDNCDVKIYASPNEFSVQTKSTEALMRVMRQNLGWDFDVLGVQTSNGKTRHPYAAALRISLPSLVSKSVVFSGYPKSQYLPMTTLMAVRVDGGKLLPLLYDGRFRNVNVDPKVRTLELFIKSDKPLLWNGLRFDVRNSEMTFYRNRAFPAR